MLRIDHPMNIDEFLPNFKDKVSELKERKDKEHKKAVQEDDTRRDRKVKKTVFRFQKQEGKQPYEYLVIDSESVSSEKKVRKEMDDIKNQLASISIQEKPGESEQKLLMGFSNKERDEKNSGYETKYILKLTSFDELRELKDLDEKSFQSQQKNLYFNQHIKNKREEMLNQKRKINTFDQNDHKNDEEEKKSNHFRIVDIKHEQKDDVIYCNDEALIQEFDNGDQDSSNHYYYILDRVDEDYRVKGMQGKIIVNASVHQIIDNIAFDDDDMLEDRPVPKKDRIYNDDYDSNGEDNSSNDYPDEESSFNDSEKNDYYSEEDGELYNSEDDDEFESRRGKNKFEEQFWTRMQAKKRGYNAHEPGEISDDGNDMSEEDHY